VFSDAFKGDQASPEPRPRQFTLEMDPQDRHAPPAPLPADLAAQSAADRAEAEEQRERVR
jgi:hypothetical protein